jgi:hypothetical protein
MVQFLSDGIIGKVETRRWGLVRGTTGSMPRIERYDLFLVYPCPFLAAVVDESYHALPPWYFCLAICLNRMEPADHD